MDNANAILQRAAAILAEKAAAAQAHVGAHATPPPRLGSAPTMSISDTPSVPSMNGKPPIALAPSPSVRLLSASSPGPAEPPALQSAGAGPSAASPMDQAPRRLKSPLPVPGISSDATYEVERLRRENGLLRSELTRAQAQIDTLNGQAAEARTRCIDAEARSRMLQKKLDAAEAEAATLRSSPAHETRAAASSPSRSLLSAASPSSAESALIGRELSDLRRDLKELQSALTIAETQREAISRRAAEAEGRLQQVRQDHTEAAALAKRLSTELASATADRDGLVAQNADLRTRIARLEADVTASAASHATQLERATSAATQRGRDEESTRWQERLQALQRSSDAHARTLREELAAANAQHASERESLQSRINALEVELRSAQAKGAAETLRAEAATERASEAWGRVQELEDALSAAHEAGATHEARWHQAKAELATETARADAASERATQAWNRVRELDGTLATAREQLAKAEADVRQIHSRAGSDATRAEAANERAERMAQRVRELEDSLAKMREQARGSAVQLQEELSAARSQADELRRGMEDARSRADAAEATIQHQDASRSEAERTWRDRLDAAEARAAAAQASYTSALAQQNAEHADIVSALRHRITDLESASRREREAAGQRLTEAEAATRAAQAEAIARERALADAADNQRRNAAQLQAAEQRCTEVEAVVAQLSAELQKALAVQRDLQSQLTHERGMRASEGTAASTQLRSAEERAQALAERAQESEAAAAEANRRTAHAEASQAVLRSELDAQRAEVRRLLPLVEKVANLEAGVAQARQDHALAFDEIQRLTKQLDESDGHRLWCEREIEALRQEAASARAEALDLREQLRLAEDQLRSPHIPEEVTAALHAAQTKARLLEEAVGTMEKENSSLAAAAERWESEAHSAMLTALRAASSPAAQRHVDSSPPKPGGEAVLAGKAGVSPETRDLLHAKDDMIRHLRSEVDRLRDELASLAGELAVYRQVDVYSVTLHRTLRQMQSARQSV